MPIAVRADESKLKQALRNAAAAIRRLQKARVSAMPIPDDAATIGPGYMTVWANDKRIHMRFRNMPRVTVIFDRKAAADFGEWLRALSPEAQ